MKAGGIRMVGKSYIELSTASIREYTEIAEYQGALA
jgi:hypothetical protein